MKPLTKDELQDFPSIEEVLQETKDALRQKINEESRRYYHQPEVKVRKAQKYQQKKEKVKA